MFGFGTKKRLNSLEEKIDKLLDCISKVSLKQVSINSRIDALEKAKETAQVGRDEPQKEENPFCKLTNWMRINCDENRCVYKNATDICRFARVSKTIFAQLIKERKIKQVSRGSHGFNSCYRIEDSRINKNKNYRYLTEEELGCKRVGKKHLIISSLPTIISNADRIRSYLKEIPRRNGIFDITIDDVAKILKMSKDPFYYLAERGELIRTGKRSYKFSEFK